MLHPSIAVLEYNLATYRRVWRASVLSSFALPLLFLLGMGVSVGSYVDARGALGTDYLDFIAPGLLMSTALQVAVGESTWPVYGSFSWTRVYHSMLATPLRVRDILAGSLSFVLVRVLLASVGFLVVMLVFGAVHSWRAVVALPVCVVLGLAIAAPCFAYAASVKADGMFAVLLRFGVIPMTLFAGVFFPVDSLPDVPRWLAYASPLWHGVELGRASTLGIDTEWGWPVHLGYLVLWCVGGFLLALHRFTRKLSD
ncbi:ABC transporter permease [Virgisporangium ochraceum]|uniref:Transport permease protein n=1 Tax=Virgisporangium ochraceum TaxID=65505 RepID=A0A8J3ZPW9_9ACTN|nr:ABC transporter permease [Virgisporangium ochraceum]GIJ67769.1 transport permease protein [Virgisporangium ochraceum]